LVHVLPPKRKNTLKAGCFFLVINFDLSAYQGLVISSRHQTV
jgi:hypothetical protein